MVERGSRLGGGEGALDDGPEGLDSGSSLGLESGDGRAGDGADEESA